MLLWFLLLTCLELFYFEISFFEKDFDMYSLLCYLKLFDYYTTYQNNNVKHGENCSYNEIEFVIYLTGSFMRLLLSII